jgi:hypothetical protein
MAFQDKYSASEIEQMNKKFYEKNEKDFKAFKKAASKGECWLCKKQFNYFNEDSPCPHWLLMPKGFRKKHVKYILDNYTYDVIEGFLRWYVNSGDNPFRNINDIKDEHDPAFIRAFTIKNENLEWSFSFSQGCLEGKDGKHGPHYHFQMRVNDRRFFDYGDYHIKLSPSDLEMLDIQAGKHPDIVFDDHHAMGMEGFMNRVEPEDLLKNLRRTEDEKNATFHMQTMVVADPGTEISGDEVADLIEESRRTGVPIAHLIKRLNNVKTRVFIEPGDAVPKAAQRKKTRTKKKTND